MLKAALLIPASLASADVGFAFVDYVGLPLGLVFLPAILIETAVVWRSLGLTIPRSFGTVFLANLLSTVVGLVLAKLEEFALRTWLYGARDGFSLSWGLFLPEAKTFWTAVLAHLVPAYVLSVYLEAWVVHALGGGVELPRVRKALWIANAASYALMIAVLGYITFVPRWF